MTQQWRTSTPRSPHDSMRDGQVCFTLVHHANQYVITDGYADREGLGDILGIRGSSGSPTGLLPLLQMHLDYRVPLNLHLSGTLLEAIAWHCPESFTLLKRLLHPGFFELVGSTFSQNIMPYFSEEQNIRQINDELWLYREHLKWDVRAIKAFWVPERVWDGEKLGPVLRSSELLNSGFRFVLLDDRLVYPVGHNYSGSEREWFDRNSPLERAAFTAWEISGAPGLALLPISLKFRYLIPPAGDDSLRQLSTISAWLRDFGDEHTVAVYADDLEKAAGVGSWDAGSLERYEHFLRWLVNQEAIRPTLIGEWADTHSPAGRRIIERGTFYELARTWGAGEDYRSWYEDPNCHEHREYLLNAEQALVDAERRGADAGLLELGRSHLGHCWFETSWHDISALTSGAPASLAPWVAAITSHARACLVIAAAAEWFVDRDGLAHAGIVDIDNDGAEELVLKNDHLFAIVSPRWGGRLTHLFDLTCRSGCLVIGNISDDWNWQEELHRYMDHPRNHPGAFADVGHEHDTYEAAVATGQGLAVGATLQNVEPGSPLRETQKQIRLAAHSRHLCVRYRLSPAARRVSTEFSFSPDYLRLLRHGRARLAAFDGPDWRGWRNGASRVWLRLNRGQSAIWDKPREPECGHAVNLRVTAFSRALHLDLGVGTPQRETCHPFDVVFTPGGGDPQVMRKVHPTGGSRDSLE